jgi:DNA primase
MLGDAPLATFLEEHPHIHSIGFCLDNDEPGRKATGHLLEKYQRAGYEVSEIRIPAEYKDMNEWHVANAEMQMCQSETNRKV